MSKITENVTKALQSIELAEQDLKSAYRDATALECIALDHIRAAIYGARCGLDRFAHALEAKE